MLKALNSNNRSLQDQLVLFGTGLPCLFMFPFSIYRFLIGDYAIAVIDLLIGAGLVTIFLQSWYSNKVKYLNTFAVIVLLLGVSCVVYMKGISMVFWVFPAIIFTYFILKSKDALLVNTLFIAVITYIFLDVLTKNQILSIYPSLILVCLFGFAFSLCSESQNKKLLKLVSEDRLTGVGNRRSFDEKIEEVLANNQRNPSSVSMLLLDLDFFKKINDSYGHKQGDQVLIDFSQKVKSIIRTTDYMYRFGGEEFVVIAKNSSLEQSAKLAETIRIFIQESPSLAKYEMTVSIGVSEITISDDAESCFHRADSALYKAKSSGRNRVGLGRFDDNNEVICDILMQNREVKPLSTKTHNQIRPRDDKSSDGFVGQKSLSTETINLIDKV